MQNQESPQSKSLKPEWLNVADTVAIFAISRSRLYELMSAGKIKYASLKQRGNIRGKRLISYDSVSDYIEGFAQSA